MEPSAAWIQSWAQSEAVTAEQEVWEERCPAEENVERAQGEGAGGGRPLARGLSPGRGSRQPLGLLPVEKEPGVAE
jgi:hypothetical protein